MTSTLGVVAGLLATNATAPKILAAAIGIAVAATVGMGAGQYLSDGDRNMRKARGDGRRDADRLGPAGDSIHLW